MNLSDMNLFEMRAEQLVDRKDPQDLLDRLASFPQLTSSDQEGLQHVLSHWVVRAISITGDVEGLITLDKLCALAIRASGSAEFVVRLSTLRSLLEIKRLAVNARGSSRANNLLHAQPILEALADGALVQSTLGEILKLSPGRVSQLLNVMEEAGLVQREKSGKENLVSRSGTCSPAEDD
jgi:DNA-binding transcriptional ArsR family regulator